MDLHFVIDGQAATFKRNQWTGTARLLVNGQAIKLASALNPRTQFQWSTTKVYSTRVGTHRVEITKRSERRFGGMLPAKYEVKIDGELVIATEGL